MYFLKQAALVCCGLLALAASTIALAGGSSAAEATFRAVEHRRGLVRSTNTGISALIDPLGRITTKSGQHTKETVLGTLPLMETRPTLYTWLGDSLGWICVAMVAGVLWRARKPRS